MKKIFLTCLFVIMTVSGVQAVTFTNSLPGGKNYLDPENMQTNNDQTILVDPIKIKPNTDYTIQFPGDDIISNHEILLMTDIGDIFDDLFSNLTECTVTEVNSYCIFNSGAATELEFVFTARDLGLYVQSFEYDNFQLEEGTTPTTYAPYVAPYVDGNSPEFSGSGAYIVSYDENIPLSEIIGTSIIAVDDIDGDITSSIVIESDDYSMNMNTVGNYLVELSVSDTAGNTAQFNLTVIVKDEIDPIITGPDSLNVDIDTQPTLETILSDHYDSIDDYDGILNLVVESDQYTTNKAILGTYEVILSATDNALNREDKTITITIEDNSAPTLTGATTLTNNLSDIKDLATHLNSLVVIDNYDDYDNIVFTVLDDNYTGNENTVGSYSVNFLTSDTSGNNSNHTITINVEDDIHPTFLGPELLSVSYTEELTIEEIIDMYTVTDNYDVLSTSDIQVISNDYHQRTTDIGTFDIGFEVQDSSGNKVTKTLSITVVDDQAPVIYIDNYVVSVSAKSSFSEKDALMMMINNKEIPNEVYDVHTILDEYTGNEDTPGVYNYQIELTNKKGETFTKDLLIKVQNDASQYTVNSDIAIRNVVVYSLIGILFIVTLIKSKK